ncbi:MAG: hypothetical protein ACFNVK_03930 [Prevotella sp.]
MKNMAKRGRRAIKKWGFRGKKCVIGVEKRRAGNQTRKAKWCKMQVVFLKIDITKDTKVINSAYLPTLWPIFSLERSEI